ncbi:hypothetical protein GCM10010372_58800 [Streptomyces tauricus]|nr:hypothetical protein GCM10010372_58800 [Streptomyces tauricus]
MAFAQGGARVGAEVVGQGAADPLVQGEGLGPAALGGERVHEQRGGTLVEGVVGEQRGQPGGGSIGVVARVQRQLGLGEVRDGLDRDMGQPGRRGGRHRGDDRGFGTGAVAPQRQGLTEHGRRAPRIACAQTVPAGGGELLEPQGVHVSGGHVQQVAARELGDEGGRAEGPAQP